jgi:hypothetical protein
MEIMIKQLKVIRLDVTTNLPTTDTFMIDDDVLISNSNVTNNFLFCPCIESNLECCVKDRTGIIGISLVNVISIEIVSVLEE